MKDVKYVEALVEGDNFLREPEVSPVRIEAALNERGAFMLITSALERARDPERSAGYDIQAAAVGLLESLQLEIDKSYSGGGLRHHYELGAPLSALGCSVATRLAEIGILSFEEVAILRLSDLKQLIANQHAEVRVIVPQEERQSA